jgi:putative phage-type endonuclease
MTESAPELHCDVDWAPYREEEARSNEPVAAVQALLARHRIDQHCAEWHAMRRCMLTASNCGSVMGLCKYTSKNQMFKRKTGQLKHEITSSFATDHGTKTEDSAREWVCKVTGLSILRGADGKGLDVGLLQHPVHKWLGASPDGVFRCGLLLEIKCPVSRAIRHEVPPEYYAQMQMQLEVANLEACVFAQYKPSTVFQRGTLDILLVARNREWFDYNFKLHFNPFWLSVVEFYAKEGTDAARLFIKDLDSFTDHALPSAKRRKGEMDAMTDVSSVKNAASGPAAEQQQHLQPTVTIA